MQEGLPETLFQGQEVRTHRVIIMTDEGQGPSSKFLKVKCSDCSNEQVVFNKPSISVTCQVCGATLATPTGGKAILRGEVVGVLE